MDEFLQQIGTLGWWISVVFVGLILAVLGSYLTRGIDRAMSSGWSAWRRRSDRSLEKYTKEVAHQVRDQFGETDLSEHTIYYAILGVMFMVMGVFTLGLCILFALHMSSEAMQTMVIVLLITAGVLEFIGCLLTIASSRSHALLIDVRKAKREL